MGFFFADQKRKSAIKKRPVVSEEVIESLRAQGCAACPQRRVPIRNGDMLASGAKNPLVYILGEAPGADEDMQGRQFVGKAGKLLRGVIGKKREKDVRFNNCIRCHPEDNRDPTDLELECCRNSIIEDIEKSKPTIIIGTGRTPLLWVLGKGIGSITQWRGKRIPVKIGNHSCWLFPIFHPSFVLRKNKADSYSRATKTQWERCFELDIDKAFDFAYSVPIAPVVQTSCFLNGINWVEGKTAKEADIVFEWLDELLELEEVGCDIETQNLRPYHDDSRLLTIALGNEDRTYAFPVDHPEAWGTTKLRNKIVQAVGDFLYKSGTKVCQNLKFEQEWFAYYYGKNILRATKWDDTMSLAYVIDERKYCQALEFLTLEFLGFDVKALSPKLNKKNMVAEPLNKVLPYNGLDTKYLLPLLYEMWNRISGKADVKLKDVYQYHIDLCPTLVLAQMEGMDPDFAIVEKLNTDLLKQVHEIEQKIQDRPEVIKYTKKHGSFNPASSAADVRYVFEKILNREEGITKTGGYSTDEKVLNSMPQRKVPLAKLILDFRGVSKLRSTYVDSTYKHTYSDGLMHTNYGHTFTSTGRLNSEDPNNQNYPARKYKYVRKIIIPKPEHLIVCADYGQIDARNIAMASEDEYYIDALWKDLDVHEYWTLRMLDECPRIFDIVYEKYKSEFKNGGTEDEVIKRYRKDIKNTWTFPLFYGSVAEQVADACFIPVRIAKKLEKEFWDQFKGVYKWREWLVDFYNKHGYVETLNGRRRHGPMKINEIYNSTIQGATAEIVGDAMTRCSLQAFPESELFAKGDTTVKRLLHNRSMQPFMQIHDDLTNNVLNDKSFNSRIDRLAKTMCQVPFDWISVPIVVEVTTGPNWHDQKEYKVYRSNEL